MIEMKSIRGKHAPRKRLGLFDGIVLDSETGCWNWAFSHAGCGYGYSRFRGKAEYVHRISAALWLGFDLDSGLQVLHHCDNPNCFNPKHLFIGTQKDNMQDCITKGRMVRTAEHKERIRQSKLRYWANLSTSERSEKMKKRWEVRRAKRDRSD